MIVSLFAALFVKKFGILLIILFAVAGVGWAIINVNSYPMFVELSNNKNLGKFTGYYYSASQIAQSITPIIIGFVMDFLGYKAFFPYAAIFMTLALAVFVFVKVNRKKPETVEAQVTEEIEQPESSSEEETQE